jgi:hypothetical protein
MIATDGNTSCELNDRRDGKPVLPEHQTGEVDGQTLALTAAAAQQAAAASNSHVVSSLQVKCAASAMILEVFGCLFPFFHLSAIPSPSNNFDPPHATLQLLLPCRPSLPWGR